MYDIEKLYEAKSPMDASDYLCQNPDAIIIAGGSDVLIKIRDGKLAGAHLVSIYGLDELRGVTMEADGNIKIGPLTCFSDIAKNPVILENIPVLADAVSTVGGPQIRNIGTVGGNTCNGVTSADSASTFLAYDAQMEILGPNGTRKMPIEKFYTGAGKVDLKPGEILVSINISKESYAEKYGSYYKYSMRNAMDIATSTCSVNLSLTDDKKSIKTLRAAYGVAAPIPTRAHKTEEMAAGMPISKENIDKISQNVLEELNPRDSWRASKALRQHILTEMTKTCIEKSIEKAGGAI